MDNAADIYLGMGDEDDYDEQDDDEDLRRPPGLPRPEGEPLSVDEEEHHLEHIAEETRKRLKRNKRYRKTTRDDYNPFPVDEEGNVIGVPVNYGPPIEELPEGQAAEPVEDSTAALLSMFGPR